MKYINHEQLGIVLFSPIIKHSEMARYIAATCGGKIKSAGFVDVYGNCYGESVGLNLRSKEEDTGLLKAQYI